MMTRIAPSLFTAILLTAALGLACQPGCNTAPKQIADTGKATPSPAEKDAAQRTAHASLAAYPAARIASTDPASGMTFDVAPDGRTLVARSADREETFKVDVIAQCGSPAVGTPVIRQLAIQGPSLEITFGKHASASLDLKSRTLTCQGSD